jgi:PAS domain S-box-containing protein
VPGKKATRFISVFGNILAVLLTIFPPAVFYYLSHSSQQDQLRIETKNEARHVTDFINKTQDLWKYDEIRLRGILSLKNPEEPNEIRRVWDAEGNIILQVGKSLRNPVMTSSHEVMDAGRVVGKYEVLRSVRPILIQTGWVAVLGGLLGLAGLWFLKKYPLKTLLAVLGTLANERDRAHITLASIGDSVIVTDSNGNLVALNRVGEQLTGWREDEARGQPLFDVFVVNRKEMGSGNDKPLEYTGTKIMFQRELLVSRKGTERIVDGTIAPIIDNHGSQRGSVVVCRDVTDEVREEEEVFKARKLESIGLLAGGIAHDFNNILVGILGNLSLAKLETAPGTKINHRVEEAEKASSRAKDLSMKLLAFSKGGKPIRKLLVVSDLLKESAHLAVRGSTSKVTFHLPEDLWMAEADPVHMDQVIGNLVINATHAMPNGGTIHIEAENAVVEEGEYIHVKRGEYLKIRIRDQGNGIPENIVEKIFDPYFTTKEKGSGLGLTTCYTIMKNHKGNIFVESEVGVGTTFVLFLPATRQTASSVEEVPKDIFQPGSGRILFMDDEEMVREVAGQMLNHLGYEAVFAKSGEEAVGLYREMTSNGNRVDLIILDITVPGGMGGIEAARGIREIHPDTKILISSGYSNNAVMAQYQEHGFDGCVAKPYKIGELSQAIQDCLHGDPI